MKIVVNKLGMKRLMSIEPSDISKDGVFVIPEGVQEVADFLVPNVRKVNTGEGYEYQTLNDQPVKDLITSIIVPRSVEIFGEGAFAYCSNLESVIFDDESAFREFGRGCFADCEKLQEFNVPKKVKSLPPFLFANCKSMTNLFFDKNSKLFMIDYGCCCGCESLNNLECPETLEVIYGAAFKDCKSLDTMSSLKMVRDIDDHAFIGTKLKHAEVGLYAIVPKSAFETSVEVSRVSVSTKDRANGRYF